MTEPIAPDTFDRMIGALDGLPDVTTTRPSTVQSITPMIGRSQTFVIQTYRQRDTGDYVFLQLVDAEGRARLVIPPAAADAIARQRDAITTLVRRRQGKANAANRAAQGLAPAFLTKRKTKRS